MRALEKIIAAISPESALRRARARYIYDQIGAMATAHKAAARSGPRVNWLTTSDSADYAILTELADIRARSRDLIRNDGFAAGLIDTFVANDVGVGIKMQSRLSATDLGLSAEQARDYQRAIEREFSDWCNNYADAGEHMTFAEMQALIDKSMLINGEAIILRRVAEGRPLSFLIIESDRLSTPSKYRDGEHVRGGVKIDQRTGAPRGYCIAKAHPGDWSLSSRQREFSEIPATDDFGKIVYHLYKIDRPGQTRGIPILTPVLHIFKDLAGYFEAELMANRIAACFAMIIESPNSTEMIAQLATNSADERVTSLRPGMVKYLGPGEKMAQFAPQRNAATFGAYIERNLQAIGAAVNLPLELITKDFTRANYSSARCALLEARRVFRARQQYLINMFCQPVFSQFLEWAFLNRRFNFIKNFYPQRAMWERARWIPGGWEWVDPRAEAEAADTALQSRTITYSDVFAGRGADWEEEFEQIAAEQETLKRLNLKREDPIKGAGAPRDAKKDERDPDEQRKQTDDAGR